MKKKFYIGIIRELNGDMQYATQFLFSTSSPAKHIEKVARGWRGDPKAKYDASVRGYWSGCTVASVESYDQIPQADWDVLKQYICVL